MKPELHIFIAAIFIASVGVLTKVIGNDIHPLVIGFYRVFFAMLFLLIVCPIVDKTTFKPKKKDLGMYAIIGLLFAINLAFTCLAYIKTNVQNTTLIFSIAPFFALIIAYFILKEKITKTKIITLIIAFIGILIINPVTAVGGLWNIMTLGLAIISGLLIVLMKKEDNNHSIGDVFWFFLFATIFLLPMPIIFGLGKISIYSVLIGLVSTGAAYFIYNLGLEKNIEAETSSIIENISVPIIGIIFAIIILSEKLIPNIIIGGTILIFAGIYLELHNKTLKGKKVNKRKWRKKPRKRYLHLKMH